MQLQFKNFNKPYVSLNLSRSKSVYVAILLSLTILNLSISCSYYTVKNLPTTKETVINQIETFNSSNKYVVIHSDSLYYHLDKVVINEDNQTISGVIQSTSKEHQYKKLRESKKVHRYKKAMQDPLNEVHFYLKTPTNFELNSSVSIPLSNISSISINDKNTGRSIANVLLGTVGTMFAALLLVAALKSSCPFVYIKNDNKFDFVGELYPGTITANMQKDDYLSLPNFDAQNGEYIIKVSNHLKEIQYTDLLQLLLVNHSKDIEVLLDNKGQVQTFKKIEEPVKVTLDNGTNNKVTALKKDNDFYSFNTPKSTFNSTRDVEFMFNKPKGNHKAKLYLTAKNSVWLDYIFGKFNEQFGLYYNTFQKEQQNLPAEAMKKWANGQNIPLSIYLKTIRGWQLVEQIKTVGPMTMRDIAIPIDLSDVAENKVQIKLETGFMFWEVDYVGMDFSENIDLDIQYINPSEAIDQNGKTVTDLLLENDNKYFAQPNIGDEVVVKFPVKDFKTELQQTVFLKNRGYYNYIRDYKGIPDFEKLESFREDNTFTRFSEKAYFDFVNFDLKTLAYHE
jgi:hypothetical protein